MNLFHLGSEAQSLNVYCWHQTDLAGPSADDEIGQLLNDLRREYDDGDISCLAIAIVRPTGELTTVITGWAARSLLLGAIELLKVPLLKKELEALDSLPAKLACWPETRPDADYECLLIGGKQTQRGHAATSESDPKQTSAELVTVWLS